MSQHEDNITLPLNLGKDIISKENYVPVYQYPPWIPELYTKFLHEYRLQKSQKILANGAPPCIKFTTSWPSGI